MHRYHLQKISIANRAHIWVMSLPTPGPIVTNARSLQKISPLGNPFTRSRDLSARATSVSNIVRGFLVRWLSVLKTTLFCLGETRYLLWFCHNRFYGTGIGTALVSPNNFQCFKLKMLSIII